MLAIIVAAYRKKLMLSVGLLCLPCAAFGMNEKNSIEVESQKFTLSLPKRSDSRGTKSFRRKDSSSLGRRVNSQQISLSFLDNDDGFQPKMPSVVYNEVVIQQSTPLSSSNEFIVHQKDTNSPRSRKGVSLPLLSQSNLEEKESIQESNPLTPRSRRLTSPVLSRPCSSPEKQIISSDEVLSPLTSPRERPISSNVYRDRTRLRNSQSSLKDKITSLNPLASKEEKLNAEMPTLFSAMNISSLTRKSITPLDLLRSQFYEDFTGEQVEASIGEINSKGENIEHIQPEQMLNKFWQYNITECFDDILRYSVNLEIGNKNTDNNPKLRELKDNLELIITSATFLIEKITINLPEKAESYVNYLHKNISTCYLALSDALPYKEKYHYYAAKYSTLSEYYQEALACFIECENFSDYVYLNYEDEMRWIKSLRANHWTYLTQVDKNMCMLEKGKNFSKLATLIQRINTIEASDSETKEEIQERINNLVDCYLESAKYLYTHNPTEAPDEFEKWGFEILSYLSRMAFERAKENSKNQQLLSVISNVCFKLLNNAASQGDGAAQFFLGEACAGLENYEEAAIWYGMAIAQGNKRAEDKFGLVHEEGCDVIKNNKELSKFCLIHLKATYQMDPEAQFTLGEMYANGQGGVSRNYKQAFHWYELSDAQGNMNASYELGSMYFSGTGVPEDNEKAALYFEQASRKGHIEAKEILATLHSAGLGVEEDIEKSIYYYEQAAEKGSVDAQLTLAGMYAADQDYHMAFKWYMEAAKQGNKKAQFALAEMYEVGYGMEPNAEEACRWYKVLAEQGHKDAQLKLAAIYGEGLGVKQNYPESFKWYKAAAEQGNKDAQYNLALMYGSGLGVEKSDVNALKWYKKAAKQGDDGAAEIIETMYRDGRGMPQDNKKLLKWCNHASILGNLKATVKLGQMYAEGCGVKKDYTMAVKWYKEAAEVGDGDAQAALGFMYEKGHGVQKDNKEAAKWYRLSADQGNARGLLKLAMMYRKGRGVLKDDKIAFELCTFSANQGNIDALFGLGWMYWNGRGVEKSVENALKWYKDAADQGYAKAQITLGDMCTNGEGVPQNLIEAAKWYQKAADKGSPMARIKLAQLRQKNGLMSSSKNSSSKK